MRLIYDYAFPNFWICNPQTKIAYVTVIYTINIPSTADIFGLLIYYIALTLLI